MKALNLFLFIGGLLTTFHGFAEDVSTRKITFSVFPLDQADWQGLVYAPTGDPQKETKALTFNRRERSMDYTYSGPLPLTFFRTLTDPEGDTIYHPVASIHTLPTLEEKEGSRVILFVEPADKNPQGPYTVHTMLDTPEKFPEGSVVFFNTMEIPILGVLGNHRLKVTHGASAPVDVRDYINNPAPIALAIRHNDDLHTVVSNRISFSPERRTLIILRPPRQPGSLRIRTQKITEMTKNRPQ